MFRIRSTYLYLAVALGLFCYIFFIDTKHKSTKEVSQNMGRLFDFNADEVTSLRITNANGTVLLEKQDKRWRITKPVQATPENGVIQQILNELEYVRSQRTIPYATLTGNKEDTIKQWNLSPPVVSVEFRTATQSNVLRIGRNVALTETVYARASAETEAPVYIVRAEIKTIVDRNLVDLRSRAVFDFDSKIIAKCSVREFTTGSQVSHDVELAKAKDGKWSLQKPLVARADVKQLAGWLRQLQDLRIVDFISDEGSNLSSYGLSSPVSQITVQNPDGGEELSVIVGGSPADKPNEVYAKRLRNNSVFTVNKEAVGKLLAGLPECRDKRLVTVNAETVTGVTIDQKGKTISVEKKDGLWVLESEGNAVAEVAKVQDFINLMANLKATQFVKDAATDLHLYGLDKPTVKVTLRYAQGKDSKETGSVDLLFGKNDAKLIYAKSSTEPFIYSVPSGALDSLPKEALSWRSAIVLNLDKSQLKQIAMTTKDGVTSFTRESDGTYKTEMSGYVVDKARADAQASLLTSLRTTQWLGKPLPAYGLDKPVIKIAITDATSTTTLRIGAALPTGGRAAQIEGQANAFELPLSDFNALELSSLSKSN